MTAPNLQIEAGQAHGEYINLGYDAIPLIPFSKDPLAKSWPTKPTFKQWQNVPTDANIGLRAGNGKAFLDCDDKKQEGTFSNVVNWLKGLGYSSDLLPIVQTASGIGRHVYVNFTGQLLGSRKNFVSQMGMGDFRYGPASFVAAPPSWVDGNQYRLITGDLANLPTLDIHDLNSLVSINDVLKEDKPGLKMSTLAMAIASGKNVENYPSRSEAESALILSMINSGFDYAAIKHVFDTQPCAGCYREKHTKDSWLYMQYQSALIHSHNDSRIRQEIAQVSNLARMAAWKNSGDKNIFLAHTAIAYKAGRRVYSASVRDLALEASTSTRTASNSTKRLEKMGFISLNTPSAATFPTIYSMDMDKVKHSLSTPMSGSVTVCPLPQEEWQAIPTHDAFRNGAGKKRRLGQRAGQIYQSLILKPHTVKELAVILGANPKTIKRALHKMSLIKDRATGEVIEMATLEGNTWRANLVDLNLVAAIYQTYGAKSLQREAYEQERREHARALELGAITKSEMEARAQEHQEETRERADLSVMGRGG